MHDNTDILKTAARTMTDHRMTAPGDAILVGVSGGVDSVTLLWCLLKLAPVFLFSRIGVAHLNHCLRGEAAASDMALAQRLATDYGLPFHGEVIDIAELADRNGLSLEEAARQARYAFFTAIAASRGYDKIATAHHADDNAEQVLMALLRGAGPAGLAGIPPVREGRIIRPFIHLTRADIVSAAAAGNLEHTQDESNNNPDFIRNRVRHRLIPLLRESFNPNIVENLNRLADICRQEETWLEGVVSERLSGVLLKQEGERVILPVSLLIGLPRALQRRLVRKALEMIKGDLRRVALIHIDAIIHCLEQDRLVTLDLPGEVVAVKSGGELVFCPAPVWRAAAAERAYRHVVLADGPARESVFISETGARIDFSVIGREAIDDLTVSGGRVAFFDIARLRFPLTIRNVLPGDRFVPLGMTGRQKVKDFFINRKVSRPCRRACPVVESGGTIIWLAGFRMADPVRVTAGTTRVLKAELITGSSIPKPGSGPLPP